MVRYVTYILKSMKSEIYNDKIINETSTEDFLAKKKSQIGKKWIRV
jgi:hypothetical protein